MTEHKDFNVGCPKCRCTVFDTIKGVVLRSIFFRGVGKHHIYKRDLFRCSGCGSLIQVVDDNKLEIVEVESHADKSSG